MRKISCIMMVLSLASLFLLPNSTLFAAEGLKVGEAELTPYGEITLQYDDNIYLDESDEKDDFIISLTPGIKLEHPFQDNLFTLDYHLTRSQYLDHSSQDATSHYLSGNLELEFRDVTFNIYNDYMYVYERPSTEDTSRIRRHDNTTGIKADFQRERFGVQLGYEHFIRDYRDEDTYDAYDRTDDIYSIMLTHQTFEKTKLLFEYDYARISYDEDTNSDSDYHQFLVGAIGELTPKTTATIKAGYQNREYERLGEPGFDEGVLYADLVHQFSEKNALKLSLARTAEESTYGANNFYKVENVSATFDHYFTHRLMGFITGLHQINDYPEETTEGGVTQKREDKYTSLGAGLRYYMREWLTLTLRMDHIVRDSNFATFDYEQNLVTFTARAEF